MNVLAQGSSSFPFSSSVQQREVEKQHSESKQTDPCRQATRAQGETNKRDCRGAGPIFHASLLLCAPHVDGHGQEDAALPALRLAIVVAPVVRTSVVNQVVNSVK